MKATGINSRKQLKWFPKRSPRKSERNKGDKQKGLLKGTVKRKRVNGRGIDKDFLEPYFFIKDILKFKI